MKTICAKGTYAQVQIDFGRGLYTHKWECTRKGIIPSASDPVSVSSFRRSTTDVLQQTIISET
jgi:hypothetical protein